MKQRETAASGSRDHYLLLDGLRGVAALTVLLYHVFEGIAFSSGGPIRYINHGYLAVDFFFMLSGFVISYAYDRRGKQEKDEFTVKRFLIRRLIRLHPMVILGSLIGLASYLIQGGVRWDGTGIEPQWIAVALFCSMLLIPALPGSPYDVRGNKEIFPLNGPSWSLFFEYVGNILYALLLRRVSVAHLKRVTGILAIILVWFSVTDASGYGMFGVGWTFDGINIIGGTVRMLFPFTMGMFLRRRFFRDPATPPLRFRIPGAFPLSTLTLLILLNIPYLPTPDSLSDLSSAIIPKITLNGIFESLCIVVIFPLLILTAASGSLSNRHSAAACSFLGEISYPLYALHYPLMYLLYDWMIEHRVSAPDQCWIPALITCLLSILLAYISLKLYDIPLRKRLSRRIKER